MSISPIEQTAGDLLAPNGKVFRATEHLRNGSVLYVLDGVDPAKCLKVAMATRMELERGFGTELLPLGGAA